MKKQFVLVVVLSLVAVLMVAGLAAAAPAEKVDVCHAEGNGSYILINISDNAYPAHVDHGDAAPGDMVPGMEGKKFDEVCNVVDAAPTVTFGYSGLTGAAGVRYRGNSSGNEIYLGVPDLGVGGNRVEKSYPNVYVNWQDGTYVVTFSFDKATDKIGTSISGPGGYESLDYPLPASLACPVADWNTMDINVVDRLTTGELAFNNVTLNGYSIGDFDDEGWNNWTVSGFDFSNSFTVSGDMVVQGWTGSETNKLQIVVGCLP